MEERTIIKQISKPHLLTRYKLKEQPINEIYVNIPDTFNKKIYVHYGATKFSKRHFRKIKNVKRGYNLKPKAHTGLWASPLDTKEPWYECCAEIFANNLEVLSSLTSCFLFTLKPDANVVHIYKHKDLLQLPVNPYKEKNAYYNVSYYYPIDFEKCIEQGIDAIELHLSESEEWDRNHKYKEIWWNLYGWDCDCIFIMNPNVVNNLLMKKLYMANMKFINNSIIYMYEVVKED